MPAQIRMLTDTFAVAPQLSADDMADLAAAGFKSVIINRPDYEEGPHQPVSVEVIAAAQAAGLTARYQPVISGGLTQEDVLTFAGLLKTLPAPVLAYCRSGARCTQLFQAASAL